MFAVDSICLSTYSNVSSDCWAKDWRPKSALFSCNSNAIQSDRNPNSFNFLLYSIQVVFTVCEPSFLFACLCLCKPHYTPSSLCLPPSVSPHACLSVSSAARLLAYMSEWAKVHVMCSSSDLWPLSHVTRFLIHHVYYLCPPPLAQWAEGSPASSDSKTGQSQTKPVMMTCLSNNSFLYLGTSSIPHKK